MKPGILLVNKPQGFTSFDVIAVLRGILHERRLGHTGTLDPMATGVLPVLVGSAAKAADILPENEKRYEAGFKLGLATDTLDVTGKTVETVSAVASHGDIERVLECFRGKIMQTPPMYSAVRVNGRRLYELARRGEEVKRQPREVHIYRLELLEFNEGLQTGRLMVSCSKGTYIRSLIDDIARAAGTLGVMTDLVRTYSQGFELKDCLSLDEIKALDDPFSRIIPVDRLFECYKRLDLNEKQAAMYKNGVRLDCKRVRGANESEDGIYRVYGAEFLGLCVVSNGELRVYKNFWQ